MDTFLDNFCREKTEVIVYFTDEKFFIGTIEGFNDAAIWLTTDLYGLVIINRNKIICIREDQN